MSTDYHAKYFAHELTKRSASDSLAKLGQSLFNATVDLNPHQIDAALFAFRSPLSRGALLADEVGLGKTIEAGLIVSQLWAERRRRILIIVPTTLRKQWAQELADKFFIPSDVLDSRLFNALHKSGRPNPFEADNRVLIVSYHFAAARMDVIRQVPWDLVVLDEAHRLRNVYKTGNKIARAIKDAVLGTPKVLLTATPLQNSLLELYGLVGFLDEHIFGDIQTFRARYVRGTPVNGQLEDLKRRLRPICQRTLRRQVTEYVRFTHRIPITQDFTPTEAEQRLYDLVSAYLQRPELLALPSSQRTLMTLVLRKLLASSTFAITGTLRSLMHRLEHQKDQAAAAALEEDFEAFEELAEEWSEEGESDCEEGVVDDVALEEELKELAQYHDLAASITRNAKGEALLVALAKGFEKLSELGAHRKAVIFTESRRTQEYLLELLESNGYARRVMTFNGTNTDKRSAAIYGAWQERHAGEEVVTGSKAVDLRAALVEHFRDQAEIMIATEAAAEGVNLQFCSLVVNYDLPWNPQRIEQRIGRCHRYGQKHDVVVINFLNRKNEADLRVFQLLSEKFRLFDGVFGASDEVLGALESGVDFEKRVAAIYQNCRTAAEIDAAFNELQEELEEQITARLADTRAALLEHFDEDVTARLRFSKEQATAQMDRLQRCLWNLTRHELREAASFDEDALSFTLERPPVDAPTVPAGAYQFVTRAGTRPVAHPYRPGHPLAELLVTRAAERALAPRVVVFDYGAYPAKISLIERLQGQSGWLTLVRFTVEALEREDHLLFAAVTDDGETLDQETCEKMMLVPGQVGETIAVPGSVRERFEAILASGQAGVLAAINERNSRFFDEEIEKLDRWADDLKYGLEQELKELDVLIKQARKEAKLAIDLEAKLALHRQIKDLEAERSSKRRMLFDAQDEVDARKESLIADVEARLRQRLEARELFVMRWEVA